MGLKKGLGKICFFSFFLLALVIYSAYAQRLTGKITGVVTEEDGTPLPGVNVDLSSPSLMGGVRSQLTAEKGVYHFVDLPPGTYKLIFSLQGFQAVERLNIKVVVNGTVTENIILKQAAVAESIVVTAESPIVDVSKSGLSTVFDKDSLEKIPSGRFTFFDVIKQAPGLTQAGQDSDRTVAFGSNQESNNYQLDGVDVSNPEVGHAWQWVNPEVFAEVETTGIGTPAEYGNFAGAVINIVTKSGGNKFEGSLSYYGQFSKLTSNNNPVPKEPLAYPYHRDKFLDGSFSLGGPIVKDRLWFFSSYERVEDSYSTWYSDPQYPAKYIGDKAFFKLSAQLSNKHKLVGFFYYEYFDLPGQVTPYNLAETVSSERGHTPTWNIMYSWLISNNAYFELKYSGYWGDDDMLPSLGGNINNPSYYDGFTGITSGAPVWPWMSTISKHQVHANFSYFAEDFLKGDHDFRAGVQYTRGASECHGGYSGGRSYYMYNGYPYYMYKQNVFSYGGVVNSIGAFFDDSWKIGNRLVINLGMRFDHSRARIPSFPTYDGWTKTSKMAPGIDDLVTWNSFSPRIGLAFQLTSDKKTLLKASYGRYYEALLISNWESPGPGVTDWDKYYWDGNSQTWILIDTIPGVMGYTVDPKLKNPYADQISFGLEREILPNFSLGATFLYKNEKNLLGWEDRGGEYEKINLVSPDNGQTYTVYNQVGNLGSNDYWITNPSRFERFEQTFKAGIFELKKRFSNNWQLSASLTWAKSSGLNATGHSLAQQATIWHTGKYAQDPNDLINARGALPQDRRWVFKLQGSYLLPWDISLSLNYLYQTGNSIPTFVRVYPNQGVRRILSQPREKDRYHSWNMVDFRIQKTFEVYKSVKVQAILDVFNLLNANTTLGFASYNYWASDYKKPNDIFYPRRLQLGLRLEF
jgi:hypothetical protein